MRLSARFVGGSYNLLVGQDERGHHFVCENYGVLGGEFADRATALQFARQSSNAIAGSLVVVIPQLITSPSYGPAR